MTRVGASAADGATITIPVGHQAGDLLVMYAFRSALTAPSLPAGWTNLQTASAGATSYRLGWKLAISNADTSGTWTNATGLIVAVYRSQTTNQAAVANQVQSTATGTTVTYPTTPILKNPGTSWILCFGAIVTTTSTIETAPTDLTNITNTVGATVEYAAHDSNGPYGKGKWPATAVAVGVSAEWRSHTLEILSEQGLNNNYQFLKTPDGISTTEKIR